jgi:hypothetical protein
VFKDCYFSCACCFVVDGTSVQYGELKVTSVDAFILSQQILVVQESRSFRVLHRLHFALNSVL